MPNEEELLEQEQENTSNKNDSILSNQLKENAKRKFSQNSNSNNSINMAKKAPTFFNNKIQNPGKQILNNNTNISKPDNSSLNTEKQQSSVKEKLAKNFVKKAVSVFLPPASMALEAMDKSGIIDNKKNEKEKNTEDKKEFNNPLNNKNNNNSQSKEKNAKTEQIINIMRDPVKRNIVLGGLCFVFISLILIAVIASITDEFVNLSSDSNQQTQVVTDCSEISLTNTSLSRDEFISKLQSHAAKVGNAHLNTFAEKAGTIYDLSIQNNFNPELVVIRAKLEGFSPVSKGYPHYNYWGIKCYNGAPLATCAQYPSFDAGVLGYITLMKGYKVDTLLKVFSEIHYAYIGSTWNSTACYYLPYIKKYMDPNRVSEVQQACASGNHIRTTDADQLAYSKYNVESSLSTREAVFGISTDCSEDNAIEGNGDGVKVAKYAVKTFDNFGYSQPNRMSDSYVDCSSMVWRSYMHFGVQMGGSKNWASNVSSIYSWCVSNNKIISGNNLQPGDLVIRFGSNSNHVEMYIGNNQTFGAHTDRYPHDRQVSIVPYKGGYQHYCRPLK